MSPEDREEIRTLIAEMVSDDTESKRLDRYVHEIITMRRRARQAEADNGQLARHRRTDDLGLDEKADALVQSLRRRVSYQEERIERLQEALTEACESNHRKNLELDAMHWVWCDGGCEMGVHRYSRQNEKVTQEIVEAARRNTERLQEWYATGNTAGSEEAEEQGDGSPTEQSWPVDELSGALARQVPVVPALVWRSLGALGYRLPGRCRGLAAVRDM